MTERLSTIHLLRSDGRTDDRQTTMLYHRRLQ